MGLGLSRLQFAEKLGVHPTTLAKWETGQQRFRATHALLIRLIAERSVARGENR